MPTKPCIKLKQMVADTIIYFSYKPRCLIKSYTSIG
jgi:hypothetical protein